MTVYKSLYAYAEAPVGLSRICSCRIPVCVKLRENNEHGGALYLAK